MTYDRMAILQSGDNLLAIQLRIQCLYIFNGADFDHLIKNYRNRNSRTCNNGLAIAYSGVNLNMIHK